MIGRVSTRRDRDLTGFIDGSEPSMPYGTVTDHGTMLVGFSSEQRPLAAPALPGEVH